MSTRTFVNALIGLCRESKKNDRRHQRRGTLPEHTFGAEVVQEMLESGYFDQKVAKAFGVALNNIIQTSDTRRKKNDDS